MNGGARLGLRVALVALLGGLLPLAAPPPAAASNDLLPDLRMAPVYGVRVEEGKRGRIKLRFGTIVWNVGKGPLEVRATGRDGRKMTKVSQWILTSDGTKYRVPHPETTAFYAGDGHDHWHLPGFVKVTLSPSPIDPEPPTTEVRRLRKIGFCLVDLVRVPLAIRPANSPSHAQYLVSGCGTWTSTRLRMGISLGWGDNYNPTIAHQWVDITDLPAGTYRLCATANPDARWAEIGPLNNSYWLDLALDPAALLVSIVGRGETDCQLPDTT